VSWYSSTRTCLNLRRYESASAVHGVGLAQPLRVALVNLCHGLFERVVVIRGSGVRVCIDEFVLQGGDLVLDGLGRKLFRVQVQDFGYLGDQPQGIGGVVDGEVRFQPYIGGFLAQDPDTGRVERGDPHDLGAAAHQRFDAFPHFRGSLVGEGDREDLAMVGTPGGNKVRDPVAEHTGFA
jgi:hypothetical protein